jgi:3-oxoacyl-[acyl-carrier protein] reductase
MLSNHRVAIITGVTKGIGKSIALSFAREGINLVGVSRNKEKIIEALEEIQLKHKVDCLAVQADVSQQEDVNNMLPQVLEKFDRIDVLVNCAGVGVFDYIIDSKLEDWERIIDVNLKAVYLCSKAILPKMMRQKSGSIINIASVSGLRGYARGGAYSASKFGVVGFTEVLAQEAKPHNIKVFAVCPGIVDTTFANSINPTLTDKSNMLNPHDVANLTSRLIKSRAKSQICEIGLKPINIFSRLLNKFVRIKPKRRDIFIETIKYL